MKWHKMGFLYKKCEVCRNKINKITESSNSEGKLKLICKKCGSEYEILKFIYFIYSLLNDWIMWPIYIVFLYYLVEKIQESFEILKNIPTVLSSIIVFMIIKFAIYLLLPFKKIK